MPSLIVTIMLCSVDIPKASVFFFSFLLKGKGAVDLRERGGERGLGRIEGGETVVGI